MEKQIRKSLISKLLCFIPKLIKEQTPDRKEFKTRPTKAILRILLMCNGLNEFSKNDQTKYRNWSFKKGWFNRTDTDIQAILVFQKYW